MPPLTNRQRCLRALLTAGWYLVEGEARRFHLRHPRLRQIPPGFEWVEYKTVNALYKRGLLMRTTIDGQPRWVLVSQDPLPFGEEGAPCA